MKTVEIVVAFQVEVHDKVDTDDLVLEFDCEFDKMIVSLASDTSTPIKANVLSYETTAVDVFDSEDDEDD